MKQDPTNYQPWTPASLCNIGSAIGGIIGGVGSLIGGSQAAGAAEDASGAQVEAARIAADVSREALGFQREVYNVGRADLAPYRATGAGALQTMNNMFLPGGQPMVQMQGRLNELRAERARLMSGAGVGGASTDPAAGAGALDGWTGSGGGAFIPGAGVQSASLADLASGGDRIRYATLRQPGDPSFGQMVDFLGLRHGEGDAGADPAGQGGSGGPGEGSGGNQSGPR